jgi:hypothetical protein
MIQPSASYIVIRWLRSEMIAMIGLPAVRVVIVSFDRSFGLLPASAKLTVATNRESVATAVENLATPIILVPFTGLTEVTTKSASGFKSHQRPSE